MKFLMAWRFAQFTIKPLIKGSIGLDENMRVLVSDAVNGEGIVEKLFWDFDGKTIALPQVRKNYPFEGFVSGIGKRFGGEVDNTVPRNLLPSLALRYYQATNVLPIFQCRHL